MKGFFDCDTERLEQANHVALNAASWQSINDPHNLNPALIQGLH